MRRVRTPVPTSRSLLVALRPKDGAMKSGIGATPSGGGHRAGLVWPEVPWHLAHSPTSREVHSIASVSVGRLRDGCAAQSLGLDDVGAEDSDPPCDSSPPTPNPDSPR